MSLLFSSKRGISKEVGFASSIGDSDIVCCSVAFIATEELVNLVDGSSGSKRCTGNKLGISEVIESFAGIDDEERLVAVVVER